MNTKCHTQKGAYGSCCESKQSVRILESSDTILGGRFFIRGDVKERERHERCVNNGMT